MLGDIYAHPNWKAGDGPYVWIPFLETGDGYFVLRGKVSRKSFEDLSSAKGGPLSFFTHLRKTLWVTETRNRQVQEDANQRLKAGYQNFGSAEPHLHLLEALEGGFPGLDLDRVPAVPFEGLKAEDFGVYQRVHVKRGCRDGKGLIAPVEAEPIWA